MDVEMMDVDEVASQASEEEYAPEHTLPLLVVDTNFLISHLDILEALQKLGSKYKHKIIIPYWVIQELDNLKESSRSVRHDARKGIKWIQQYLSARDPHVVGQQLTQIEQVNLRGDDSILDCCLFFRHKYNALTIIITNDKNLCVKALVHGIRTISYAKSMTPEKIADMVRDEAKGIKAIPDQDVEMELDKNMSLEDKIEFFEQVFLNQVGACVDRLLRETYSQAELDYFGYDYNFRCTEEVAEFIEKWSISVFSEFVPRAVISRVKRTKPPLSDQGLQEFIDNWGGLWLHVAPKNESDSIKQQLKHWKAI